MKGRSKLWVLLLVLAYTSQALAAVVLPCPEMAGAGGATVTVADPGANAHAGHHMAAKSDPSSAGGDCCEGGICKMSHCQFTAALPLDQHGSSWKHTALYPPTTEASSVPTPVDSLYRPPIFS